MEESVLLIIEKENSLSDMKIGEVAKFGDISLVCKHFPA